MIPVLFRMNSTSKAEPLTPGPSGLWAPPHLNIDEVLAVLYGRDVGQLNGLLMDLSTDGPLAH